MSGPTDIDDLIADIDHELEARYQALERQADLDELRAKLAGLDPTTKPNPWSQPAPSDPLRALKDAFETAHPQVSGAFLIVLCPSCHRKNRVERVKATTEDPRCGACAASLVTTR